MSLGRIKNHMIFQYELRFSAPSAFRADTGHKALCPVSLARLSGHTRGNGRVRAYYIAVSRAYLWAPALVGGHTCGSRRLGIPWVGATGSTNDLVVFTFVARLCSCRCSNARARA